KLRRLTSCERPRTCGWYGVLFPLTPALSLGERGFRILRWTCSPVAGRLHSPENRVLPLPKGEGRGEGEQDAPSLPAAMPSGATDPFWSGKNGLAVCKS